MPAASFDTARRFEALARLGQALTASLDLPRVLEAIALAACELLPEGCARIWVAEDDRLHVRAQAGGDRPGRAEATAELALGEGLIGRVALTHAPLIVEDIGLDARPVNRGWLKRQGFVAFAGVPLVVKDTLVGVLALMTRRPHRFTPHEIEVLAAFADQAAIAIENARLYASLSARVRRLNALTRLNRLISSTLDPEEVLREIASAAALLMDAKVVSFWRPDEEQRVLRLVAFSGDTMRDFPRQSLPFEFGVLGWVARHRQTVNVADVFADERFVVLDWWKRHKLKSLLGLPVLLDGKLLAVLSLNGDRPFQVDAEDTDLLDSFAAQAAVAIRNAALFAESERRRRTAEALERIGRSLARSLEPEEVGRRTVESVGELVRCEMALLYRREPPSGDLVLLAGTRAGLDWNRRFPPGTGAVGLAVEQGQPVMTTDVRGDARITLTAEMRTGIERLHDRAVLAVPLAVEDRTIGALAIVAEAGRRFTDEETSLVQAFAAQAALSLDNAQLLHESRIRQARLQTLVEVNRQLSGIQPLEPLLDSIAEACGRLLGSESVGFRVVDGDDLVVTGTWGDAREIMSVARLRRGQSLSGLVAETGEPLIVSDPAGDPRLLPAQREGILRRGYRAWLGVPVKVGGRLAGVLSVRKRQERGFSDADVDLATAFASQAAVALENVRLYTEAQERLRQTETLLNVSRAVSGTQDLTEALRRVAQETGRALRADMVGAYLADPEQRSLQPVAGYHVPPELLQAFRTHSIPLAGYPLLEQAWRERAPAHSSDAPRDPRIERKIFERFPHRAQLFVPMVVRGEPIGGLFVVWWTEAREFTAEELRLVRGICEQGALTIANAELYFEASRRRRQAEELARLTQSLTESLDLRAVAQRVVDSVRPLFGAMYSRLRLVLPDGALPLIAWSGEALAADVGSLPPGVGIAGLALVSGRPEWSSDVLHDERFRLDDQTLRGLPNGGRCAVLAAPLRAKGSVIGILTIGDQAGRVFSDEEIALLQTFADQAALALQNARLFEESEQRRRGAEASAEALRRSEEHVRQMQKMEAIGRLAGGIAHDFNNLLTVITGRSQLLLRRLREADPVRQDIALIQKTAQRAGALTRQLLAFSRKQVLQPRVVDTNAIVQGLAPMLQRLLGEDVDLTIRPAADGARVKADPGQLEQVIVNLAVNARDAMPGGGRLAIAIECVELDESAAAQHGSVPGAHVQLAVSDSGIGMDAETQARIFEPFFTTKAPGHGTGLGLATVYGIVKQHQGAIAVESGPGRGTTFRIYLPATTEPAETVASESGRGLPAGSETVLVAEDEDEVRALARDILQQVGYTVLEAGNGQEALEVCRGYPHPIHLLLSDVIMPQMSGQELAERLQVARPDIKVLYMSGYTADVLGPRALLAADRVLVEKPFTPESLTRKVRQAIDATPATAGD